MSLFVSCGEVSGDLYAAELVRALLRRRPALRGRIWGMMGPRTEEACGEFAPDLPRWSYEELKLMGITEVLPAIPRLLRWLSPAAGRTKCLPLAATTAFMSLPH